MVKARTTKAAKCQADHLITISVMTDHDGAVQTHVTVGDSTTTQVYGGGPLDELPSVVSNLVAQVIGV
jgi:hypothetical protein